jgi:hypothetical protein
MVESELLLRRYPLMLDLASLFKVKQNATDYQTGMKTLSFQVLSREVVQVEQLETHLLDLAV